MIIRVLSRTLSVVFFCVLVTTITNAQTVAVLDQGFNSNLSHRANSKFVEQHCISYPDTFIERQGPVLPGEPRIFTWRASLCENGRGFDFFRPTSARHPRVFYEPLTDKTYTTANLTHGRQVSNALWDFDRDTNQIIFQVFGLNANTSYCSKRGTIIDATSDPLCYKTNSGKHIAQALEFLSLNAAPELGAVAIATVVGDRVNTPSICNSLLGQQAVDRLLSKGIAVVAGLANNDIPAGTKTWPNCLFGVINAGRTDGFAAPYKGIGIGNNGIDFYTQSETKEGSFLRTGNSLASPKIAAMFALLHKAHPSSTVDQKILALQRTNGNYTYKGVKRTRISRFNKSRSIAELGKIVVQDNNDNNNPDDDIHFDPSSFGVAFGGEPSDEVVIDVDFSVLAAEKEIGVSAVAKSITSNQYRDLILSFTGIVDDVNSSTRKFKVKLNGSVIETTDTLSLNQEVTSTFIINRNRFASGVNTIRIEPDNSSSTWGLKDIGIKLIPAIPITVGVRDTNRYGYSEPPNRFTGARFTFDLTNLDNDHKVVMTGWDIDTPTETEAFLNGTSLGFIATTESNSFGEPNSFLLPKSFLSVGTNLIELQQAKPVSNWAGFENEKWAVKDILVEITSPDLTPSRVRLNDRTLTADEPFSITASLSNLGDGSSGASTASFYVSDDKTITASDQLLNSFAVGSIAPYSTATLTQSLSSNLMNQGKYIGVCLASVANEANVSNNCSSGTAFQNNTDRGKIAAVAAAVNILVLQDAVSTSKFLSSAEGWKNPSCRDYEQVRISNGNNTPGTLLVREMTGSGIRPDASCNPVYASNMEVSHYKDFPRTGSTFKVKGWVRARSNYLGTSRITSWCVAVIDSSNFSLLKKNCTNYENDKDSGWVEFDYDFTSEVANSKEVRVVIGTHDSWGTNWQQRVFIDDIEVTH